MTIKNTLSILLFFIISHVGYSQVFINEILASNKTTNTDPLYGTYSDWIELYNASSQTVDLSGYSLTNDVQLVKKWNIPAGITIASKGTIIFWANGLNKGMNTNFSLSVDGEFVGLLDPNGKIVDSLNFDLQKTDISYGRVTDANTNWGYFAKPTPNASNNTSQVIIKTQKPVFSLAPAFYKSPQTVSITAEVGAKIYYTINGSTPTISSSLYINPLNLTKTMVLKAIAVKNSEQHSDVITRTYFINEHTFDLPVLSISTDSNWMFNPDTGIYSLGPNAQKENPYFGANFWLDKEIPMTFHYYGVDGQELVNEEVGAKIYGGYSRANPQKSMQFKCKAEYGSSRLRYKFFPGKNIKEFKNIGIRNSGNDWGVTMFRDAFMQNMTRQYMDIDYQETQHVAWYINGKYFGLTMMIEKLNENYIAQNHDVNPDDVDLLDAGSAVLNGNDSSFNVFRNYYTNHSFSDEKNYATIKSMMDIDEYIDYMIAELYYANTDWPGNNMKYWRERKVGKKWRWIMYDTDFGFGIWGHDPCENTITFINDANGPDWPNPPSSTLLFRKLSENKGFINTFLQRYAYHMNTSFNVNRVNSLLDSIQNSLTNEMVYHMERWKDTTGVKSLDEWNNNINQMRNFGELRAACVQKHILDFYGISGIASLILKNDTSKGNAYIENKIVDTVHKGSYFKTIPLHISAKPRNGYVFKYWKCYALGNPVASTVIAKKSEWAYLDNGTDQGTAWTAPAFSDNTWKTGKGPLAYNEPSLSIGTVLSYGGDAANKYITTYFRKTVTISDIANTKEFAINLMRGDGAIVYVNGVQVLNSNMPNGTVTYTTTAYGANDADEISYLNFTIPASFFIEGKNTIAVEVHQASVSSSDLSFDLELLQYKSSVNSETIDYNCDLTLILNGDILLEPVYKQQIPIVINEIQNQSIKGTSGQFIEIYNAGDYTVDLSSCSLTGDVELTFPSNTTLKKGQFLVLCKDSTNYLSVPCKTLNWKTGSLPLAGTILLKNIDGDTIDLVKYSNTGSWPVNTSASNKSIELKQYLLDNNDGANWAVNAISGGTPGGYPIKTTISNIFINECMTNNGDAYYDEFSEFEDWVEIYNAGTTAVNIAGLYITDSDTDKNKFRISETNPSLTTIPAKGHLVIWLDNDPSQGILHANFSVNKSGEKVSLYQINYNDTVLIDSLKMPELSVNQSYGRLPDGSKNLTIFDYYTPAAVNEIKTKIYGVSINEVMPTNADVISDEKGDFDPWVELYNGNAFAVDVAGLYLSNEFLNSYKWQFPSNNPTLTTIPSKGYLLVWLDGEPSEGPLHANFKLSNLSYLSFKQNFLGNDLMINDINIKATDTRNTVGRYPQGTQTEVNMEKPTPLAKNTNAKRLTEVHLVSDNNARIYPIPMNDYLSVECSGTLLEVSILTIEGQIVQKSNDAELNVEHLPAGVYWVQIKSTTGIGTILTVKQ